MKHHRITLALHLNLAKSVADYLQEAGDDKDKALEAMRRDIVQREGQNSKARTFQRAYTKLVERLKLPEDPDDADSASDAAIAAVKALGDAGASSAQITKVLEKLKLDPSRLEEQVTALQQSAKDAADAVKLRRELAYRDAADALGYDAGKLAKVLRDEAGLPEKRSVTVKDAQGADVQQEVWGIPTLAEGKETGFTALSEHGEVKGFEAALKKAATPNPAPAPQGPTFPQQHHNPPPTGNVTIDPATLAAGFAANGAGSI